MMPNLKSISPTTTKGYLAYFEDNNISLVESRIEDIPQVSEAENEIHISSFTETEVKEVMFQLEQNKSTGPDGFPS
jgi:hypothetical protein